MNDYKKKMLSVEEFSQKANITVTYARQLLREGKIRGVKLGKEWIVDNKEVDIYLGITTDIEIVRKDMYIKELETKLKNYEMQINTFRNIVGTLGNIVGI